MRTPSTRQYSKGLRSGKILFGRKCNPVVMKQQGTVSFGKRAKQAPRPESGLNANQARRQREANKWEGRRSLQEREAFNRVLNDLVEQELKSLGGAVANSKQARQMLRTHLYCQARSLVAR